MRRLFIVLSAVALVAVGCGDADDPGQVAQDAAEEARDAAEEAAERAREGADRAEGVIDDVNVSIEGFAYSPERVEIDTGQEVTWINEDDAPHTVTAKNESFDSGNLATGDEFSERFTETGEFAYFCTVHGEDTMSGTVVVS